MKCAILSRICVAIAGSFLLWAVIPAHACDWTGAGRAFQISYSGGDGNDVVLVAVDDTLFRDRFEE